MDPCRDTAGHRQAGTAGQDTSITSIITTVTVTRCSHLKVRNAEVFWLHLERDDFRSLKLDAGCWVLILIVFPNA